MKTFLAAFFVVALLAAPVCAWPSSLVQRQVIRQRTPIVQRQVIRQRQRQVIRQEVYAAPLVQKQIVVEQQYVVPQLQQQKFFLQQGAGCGQCGQVLQQQSYGIW